MLKVMSTLLSDMPSRFAWLALILCALCLVPDHGTSAADPAPRVLVIGIDVSEGSPLLTDNAFAAKTARRIAARLDPLPPRSLVKLRSFGAHSGSTGQIEIDRVISRDHPAEETSRFLETLIAGMPKLSADGKIKPQPESNIIAFLQTAARTSDCSGQYTEIILATDGFEDSEFAVLERDKDLPKPNAALFDGCARLEMLGLGRGGGSPRLTNSVVKAWERWAQASGFKVFVGLDTW